MLDVCREYAEAYDILFNATKTKCMFFIELIVLCLMKMFNLWEALLCFVEKCKFVGFSTSCDILNRNIKSSINTFNRKCNDVRLDFSILNSDIKSKLISIFCMDLNFSSNYVDTFYTAWRKAIPAIGKLPFRTHWYLLHGINDTLPIDVMLEQRCIKFIWTLLNFPNIIVKSVMRSAIRNGYSTLGEHFRYLSYMYDLSPTS